MKLHHLAARIAREAGDMVAAGRRTTALETVAKSSPSRRATWRSCANCCGELSNTVTAAPAPARIGPCCPPPLARQSTRAPASSPNHARGTGRVGVSTTCHSPRRAAAMTSGSTGTVHWLCRSTALSQAVLLYARMSIIVIHS